MPVTNVWDNDEKTVIRMEVVGRWTWDEMYQGSQDGYIMLETVDNIVDAIIDFSQSAGIPPNALTHARNMMGRQHPRTGVTVFIGVNAMFMSLWRAFTRVHTLFLKEQDFTFAASLDEARALLVQRKGKRKTQIARRTQASHASPMQE
jgi:hypothetical protein